MAGGAEPSSLTRRRKRENSDVQIRGERTFGNIVNRSSVRSVSILNSRFPTGASVVSFDPGLMGVIGPLCEESA